MYWIYIIELIVAIIAVVALTPKPQNAAPASLQDFDVPTAEDGREVIDICGTVWIDDPNVIWYGDLSTFPIRADSGK
jgi:hypothetical protein